MRRIAIINQKGGVGKTTTTVNLGAALAIQGRRVVLVDMDAQANLSMALGIEAATGSPTAYSVLMGDEPFAACVRATKIPRLSIVPSNIDLSGAELELASAMGREYLLRDALSEWNDLHVKKHGRPACDYVLFDCPPSLGLLSINALAAADEVLITLQTEFLALQGMSKLLEIVALLKKRLNPALVVTGIVPSLYDSRLKLAREVLGEIRSYFKDQVVPHPIRANVKLAEAPSFGMSIFEYAPDSNGADDYMKLAFEIVAGEAKFPEFAKLSAFDPLARLPPELTHEPPAQKRVPPPPPKRKVTAPAAVAPPTVAHTKAAQPTVPPRAPTAPAAKPQTRKPAAAQPVQMQKTDPKPVEIRPTPPPAAKPKNKGEKRPITVQEVAPAPESSREHAQPARKAKDEQPVAKRRASGAAKPASVPVAGNRAPTKAAHVARDEDIPPLPPDAFEILSSPLDS
jgi:chromosome partitioning protein